LLLLLLLVVAMATAAAAANSFGPFSKGNSAVDFLLS
jgi:hypothetical protein